MFGNQVRLQFIFDVWVINERMFFGVVLNEKIKRVDHRHVGDEIDVDCEVRDLFVEDDPGQKVPVWILLPVDEMLSRADSQ